MHRHGYKGRKFGRETDQRLALKRGLTCALIENQAITTTLARAKEIRRDTEKLITIAKKGGLANYRLVISRLNDQTAARLLIDVIAPQISRGSGYLKVEHSGYRKGDNAEMGTISFVDEINLEVQTEAEKSASKKSAKKAEKSAKKDDKKAKKEDK